MQQPPLLPEETLIRVLRVARADGMSIVVVATLFAVMAAMAADSVGAIVGLLVAGAGALELHGAGLIRHGDARGVSWLVSSQMFLLATILTYCVVRFSHLEIPPLPDFATSMIDTTAGQLGMTRAEYLMFIHHLVLETFAVVSVFYQGGMAVYYLRRRQAVERALAGE
jgi:acetolactate synthase regulatory subunit